MRLRRDVKVDLCAGDSAAQRWLYPYTNPVEAEPSRECAEPLRLETNAHKGAQGHVAGDAGKRVKNRNGHGP